MFASSAEFAYVPEYTDFLTLFPHRHSYLWAEHPKPGERPDWQTETRHPLSDRLIQQGAYLLGVRFGKITCYLMIDIDINSRYHPRQDPYAITRIVEALEPLGLSRYVAVTSSHSGGLHLYFPLLIGQPSWAIANAATALLESKGLVPTPGQIELFPNARRYSAQLTDFNGHRLPLQNGSYLVNDDYQPIFTTQDRFVQQWNLARNHVTREAIDQVLKQFERRRWMFIKQKALKFLNDLNAEIEPGWTGFSQTNRLLGRIAIREYVFYHVLHQCQPLTGFDLADRICEVAENLPGFEQYCQHRHELIRLALYWGRAVERSDKYYPYGGNAIAPQPEEPVSPTWNQKQASDARQRIQTAVDELVNSGQFPDGIRKRIFALKAKGIGVDALYQNKDLWHGDKMLKPASDGLIPPVQAGSDDPRSLKPASDGLIPPVALISLYADQDSPPKGRNPEEHTEKLGGSGGISTASPPVSGIDHVKAALAGIRRRASRAAAEPTTPPPDENWFQLNMWQLTPPVLAGRGKDPSRIQLPLALEVISDD